ncbi:MAG: hypothetical protein LAO08_09050 [Acidobacteriia bacterium]|nr:hypothetical protein [Terriglobia bacterium]
MDEKRAFTPEEKRALSIRAVNQLIADVGANRLSKNRELAEAIAVCIRHTQLSQLQDLNALLDQRELEGVPSVDEDEKPKWEN